MESRPVVLICALACAGCTQSGDPVCGKPHPADGALYAFLTASGWQNGCPSTGRLPTTCTELTLEADGSYAWTARSDYTERDQSGSWNFSSASTNGGVICLGDGSVLRFDRRGKDLRFGPMTFSPGKPLSGRGERADLPHVNPSSLYVGLVAAAWQKANLFNLFMEPDRLQLARDGTFSASYRAGACKHGGTWSLDGSTMIPASDANTCDQRGGGTTASIAASNARPRLEGDLLVFRAGAVYHDAERPLARPLFRFDAYGDSVETTGELFGKLAAGSQSSIRFTLENRSAAEMWLEALELTLQALKPAGSGFTLDGPEEALAKQDLGLKQLASSAKQSLTVTFTPKTTGTYVQLTVKLSYKSAKQDYRGEGRYTATIK
jgi:hypothetical protein